MFSSAQNGANPHVEAAAGQKVSRHHLFCTQPDCNKKCCWSEIRGTNSESAPLCRTPQVGVVALRLRQQLIMAALLQHAATMDGSNACAAHHRRQAVGNDQRGAARLRGYGSSGEASASRPATEHQWGLGKQVQDTPHKTLNNPNTPPTMIPRRAFSNARSVSLSSAEVGSSSSRICAAAKPVRERISTSVLTLAAAQPPPPRSTLPQPPGHLWLPQECPRQCQSLHLSAAQVVAAAAAQACGKALGQALDEVQGLGRLRRPPNLLRRGAAAEGQVLKDGAAAAGHRVWAGTGRQVSSGKQREWDPWRHHTTLLLPPTCPLPTPTNCT